MIKTGQSKGQSVLMKYSENIEEIQLLGILKVLSRSYSVAKMGNGIMNKGAGRCL